MRPLQNGTMGREGCGSAESDVDHGGCEQEVSVLCKYGDASIGYHGTG